MYLSGVFEKFSQYIHLPWVERYFSDSFNLFSETWKVKDTCRLSNSLSESKTTSFHSCRVSSSDLRSPISILDSSVLLPTPSVTLICHLLSLDLW